MNIKTEKLFDRDYARLPQHLQERVKKQLALLLENLRHPSLQAHKMGGRGDIWEARVTQDYRFTFWIDGDTYRLRRVGTHEIYRNP